MAVETRTSQLRSFVSFQNGQIADNVKRLVLHGCFLAEPGRAFFGFVHLVHRHLPSPLGHFPVGGCQIGPDDL